MRILRVGDPVVYRKDKVSNRPGPRARCRFLRGAGRIISTWCRSFDITAVPDAEHVIAVTRTGKHHRLDEGSASPRSGLVGTAPLSPTNFRKCSLRIMLRRIFGHFAHLGFDPGRDSGYGPWLSHEGANPRHPNRRARPDRRRRRRTLARRRPRRRARQKGHPHPRRRRHARRAEGGQGRGRPTPQRRPQRDHRRA